MRWTSPILLGLILTGVPVVAFSQGGRLSGRILDEEGAPLAGATVKLMNPNIGPARTVTTDGKGEWAVLGLEAGSWDIDFAADGYHERQISVNVSALMRLKPIEIRLERAGPPPELLEAARRGDAAFEAGRFAEARAHYETLLARRPDLAATLHLQIARCYKEEGDGEAEIDHLKAALDANPDNHAVRTLLGMELIERGEIDEGLEWLSQVDESRIASPDVLYNIGVALLNKGRQGEAIDYFTKALAVDPSYADGYYQRGLTYLGLQKLAQARSDLKKVVELVPEGPQAETARKVLEQTAPE